MTPTARFLAEIRRSHEVIAFADITSPSGQTMRLKTIDGNVNVDRTAAVRRTATINCVDPTGLLVPSGNTGLLVPYGTRVRPYRGVKYHNSDGSTEIEALPLGVFRLSKSTITESSGSTNAGITIALEMSDRSRTVARNKFTVPYTIPKGTNLLTAIKLLLARTFQNLEYDAVTTTITTPAVKVYDVNADPWQAVTDLATSMACEVFFDVNGVVVIAPPPDVDALPSPVFSYVENQGCTMTDLQSVYSDEPGYNGVVFTGATVGVNSAPVRAVVWDEQPSSPTYHKGPYGEVPMFVDDNNVTTQAGATAAAHATLKGMLGFAAAITVTGPVNPAYEAGNVIAVARKAMHINGLYSIDAFNVPMKQDGIQNVVLKQKRVSGT